MNHGSLFSGIGGFDLAAEWMGWNNVFHCEINPFGQKVLKYYWPNAISYDDITKTDFTIHRGNIDLLSGGFPCQPFSVAGNRKGTEDHRNLWPEYHRAIKEIQPTWVVGENVPGLINWSKGMVFEQVQADLENEGYEVWPVILPACGQNAPHKRDRVWFIAYLTNTGIKGVQSGWKNTIHGLEITSNTSLQGCKRVQFGQTSKQGSAREQTHGSAAKFHQSNDWQNFPTQPPVCSGDDGIPSQLDGITFPKWRNESIKAYGNAIVPQVVYQIFKAIDQFDKVF